jgi:hypothetical protein
MSTAARATSLSMLAQDLHRHYELTGEAADIEAGVEISERALTLTAQDDTHRADRLMDVAWWLGKHHRRTGDRGALDRAIAFYQEATEALEPGSQFWSRAMASLASMLQQRFDASRDPADADMAVEFANDAVRRHGEGSHSWPLYVSLATALITRERVLGTSADLDRALEILDSVRSDERTRSEELLALYDGAAMALARRADRTGRTSEAQRALRIAEEATKLKLTPQDRAAALRNLAALLLDRAHDSGNATIAREAAREAVRVAGEAASLTPAGSIDYGWTVGLQGVVEQVSAQLDDRPLDGAVALLERAVAGVDASSPSFAAELAHLAGARAARADRDNDGEEATRALRDADRALALLGDDEVVASLPLRHRATALRVRYRVYGDDTDRVAAADAFRARLGPHASVDIKADLAAAREWQEWAAERMDWHEAVEAGQRALGLADTLLRRQVGRLDRESALSLAPTVAGTQAYALVQLDRLEEAVTVLERGRALLLAEPLRRDRAELASLSAAGYAALTNRFQAAAAHMRSLEAAEPRAEATTRLERRWAPLPPEQERQRSEALAAARVELDSAVAAIRAVPGHEDFLAEPGFRPQPEPLVHLVGTTIGGLGLVVLPSGAVEALWLPELGYQEVHERVLEWFHAYDERAADPTGWARTFDATMRWAWTTAIGPLVERLGGCERATLVPGGLLGLLPLHAAWTPEASIPSGRRYALDKLLFTYAPSARILEEVKAGVPACAPKSLLAVADPQPVSAVPLPWAMREVSEVVRGFAAATLLSGGQATRDAVSGALDGHDVLHFACHGFADTVDPQQSALLLAHDEPLTLADIAARRLAAAAGQRPRLAVLSACESGMPAAAIPDEVIGLPAGLLTAGVHGVVSSLVTVRDAPTAMLMRRLYECLREGREPAEALRDAQRWLRDATNEQLYAVWGDVFVSTPPTSAVARRLWATARPFAHPIDWAAFTYVGA